MVENGLVFAVNKSLEKERKQQNKKSIQCDNLIDLLKKYNVNFADKFSIKDWTKKDIMVLHKLSVYPINLITLNDNDKIKFDSDNKVIN